MTLPTTEIWDAVPEDVPRCLALPHESTTRRVWQLNLHQDADTWTISLRESDLSVAMPIAYPSNPKRLHRALDDKHCFVVAVTPDENDILGYLVMLRDADQPTASIRDLVVAQAHRRQGLALRLLTAAKRWAKENDILRIVAETQTKNYPAIALYRKAGYRFCGFNEQYFTNQDIAVFFCQTLRK